MMKKSVCILLCMILMAGILTGCKGKTTETQNNTTQSQQSSTTEKDTASTKDSSSSSETATTSTEAKNGLNIANIPKMIGIAWWDRMDSGNKEWANATGNNVFQLGSTTADAAEQVKTIEDAIAQGVDAMTVIPVDPDSLEPVLEKARNQNIVVISHEAANLQNVDYDIEAFDNTAYGAHLMDILAEEMGAEGNYAIMVGSLTMASHQEWAAGAIARQKEKYPNMNLVTDIVAPSATTTDASYQTAKELIASYPDIKGFIGMDMVNPPGIAMAVEEAGKSGQIAIAGTCLVSVARDYLESGTIKTITFWDPAVAGKAMCELATKVISGEKIEDGINLNVPGFENCILKDKILYGSAWIDVTTDNMKDYDF